MIDNAKEWQEIKRRWDQEEMGSNPNIFFFNLICISFISFTQTKNKTCPTLFFVESAL